IVNTDAVRQLRRDRGVGANVFTSFPRLGVDHRRTPRKFDLLIVDEVHSIAPPGRGRYAVDSLRTRAVKQLAPHCEHRLFLSATPHNGYKESFTALLELLDPQRFARNMDPNPEQLSRVLVRRLWARGMSKPGYRQLTRCRRSHGSQSCQQHSPKAPTRESQTGGPVRIA